MSDDLDLHAQLAEMKKVLDALKKENDDLKEKARRKKTPKRKLSDYATSVKQIKDDIVRKKAKGVFKNVSTLQHATTYETDLQRASLPNCNFLLVCWDEVKEVPADEREGECRRDIATLNFLVPEGESAKEFGAILTTVGKTMTIKKEDPTFQWIESPQLFEKAIYNRTYGKKKGEDDDDDEDDSE